MEHAVFTMHALRHFVCMQASRAEKLWGLNTNL